MNAIICLGALFITVCTFNIISWLTGVHPISNAFDYIFIAFDFANLVVWPILISKEMGWIV